MMPETNRGQTQTLEAIAASIFLMMVVSIIVQSMTVTPGLLSTSSDEIESDYRQIADDTLDVAVEHDTLIDTLLYYDTTNTKFVGAYTDYYIQSPNTDFGDLLRQTLSNRHLSYNIMLHYSDGDGGKETQRLVYQGEPSNNPVSTTRTVVLMDDMQITAPGNSNTLSEDSGFYAPDASPSELYNVVTVEITVWRF